MRFLRRNPLLYDAAKAAKRVLGITTPLSRFLWRFSLDHGRGVRFVQIGASDGLRRDPLRECIVRHGWCGLLVEPLSGVFDLLRRNYRRVPAERLGFVNAALSASVDGTLVVWTVAAAALDRLPLEQRLGMLRKSSLYREHVLRWIDGRSLVDADVVAVEVPCLTLTTLLERHWRWSAVQLLAIDAEGYDLELLESIDFERFSPDAILYESQNLEDGGRTARLLLERHGYEVLDMGEDTMAVRAT